MMTLKHRKWSPRSVDGRRNGDVIATVVGSSKSLPVVGLVRSSDARSSSYTTVNGRHKTGSRRRFKEASIEDSARNWLTDGCAAAVVSGLLIAVGIGIFHARYMSLLHETNMFFSSIQVQTHFQIIYCERKLDSLTYGL
jgi:hypothetical protein